MSNLSVRYPKTRKARLKIKAERQGVSLQHLVGALADWYMATPLGALPEDLMKRIKK